MSPPHPLDNLSRPGGSLKPEPPDAAEIAGLLRAKSYRASNRHLVFQELPHTLGLGPEVWRVLDLCHNKRNLGECEGLLEVDERLVGDLIAATQPRMR
jgi:hypothetical protein